MSTLLTRLAQRWPTIRQVLTDFLVIAAPTATVPAIVVDRAVLAVLALQLTVVVYGTVAATTHARHRRELYRLRGELDRSRRDPLTGLPTRAVADDFITSTAHSAGKLTVALADIDGLHAVNNNLGHAAGDLYIVTVAARLTRAVPAASCLVRHGGDEFTILAPDTDPDDLAAAIGAALAGPALIGGYRIQPRASVGIATGTVADAAHTRACADAAMYTAKAAGGNHIRVYQPDRDAQPQPDGTRPLIRRRDLNPTSDNAIVWLPTPGDDLLPFLFSLDEALSVQRALHAAGKGLAVAAAADGAALLPSRERFRYVEIAHRMTPIIRAAQQSGVDHPSRPSISLNGEQPMGISAAFSAPDIEALVITAAEAVCGDPDDLSSRQRELAHHAYRLLHADNCD